MGPVLMSVEMQDAKDNVSKRLELIEADILRIDNTIGKNHEVINFFISLFIYLFIDL